MLFNYLVGNSLNNEEGVHRFSRKPILIFGIISNVALLGYFKYTDFMVDNLNYWVFTEDIPNLNLALPLAISFFTFQQIAYLVDSYRQETKEYNFLNYALFVSFFPQLIAGPIVHHREMMPQFTKPRNKIKNYRNIAMGLFIFSIGLFKKVVIADSFAVWATAGFDTSLTLNLFEAWATSLSYTFQLYFDFSGYTDMAIGLALLFNIKLPINFNSPYKSTDIQEFWRRWHMTLSRFLKEYVYIPLGGNRGGEFRTYNNLFATFVIGGIWHGAGWTFVFWGSLHGIALVIHRAWSKSGVKIWDWLAWFITFNFVNIAWVFFRAKEWDDAVKVLSGMFGLSKNDNFNFSLDFIVTVSRWINYPLYNFLPYSSKEINNDEMALLFCLIALVAVLVMKNSSYYLNKAVNLRLIVIGSMAFSYSIIQSFFTTTEVFLYFNF
jgi:D-alanyl-lipoteichoic acid acyltransferase DltB (MBOAT superfamily)